MDEDVIKKFSDRTGNASDFYEPDEPESSDSTEE